MEEEEPNEVRYLIGSSCKVELGSESSRKESVAGV